MIVVQGRVLVTDHWPDLAQAPQPIFHRDELARLAGAQATPERYEDVIVAKRLFRGAWVLSASGPRRPRRSRPRPFGRRIRAFVPYEPEPMDD